MNRTPSNTRIHRTLLRRATKSQISLTLHKKWPYIIEFSIWTVTSSKMLQNTQRCMPSFENWKWGLYNHKPPASFHAANHSISDWIDRVNRTVSRITNAHKYTHKKYTHGRTIFWDYLKQVLPPDTFEAFLFASIFDKTAFCLGEKQGKLRKPLYTSELDTCTLLVVRGQALIWKRGHSK